MSRFCFFLFLIFGFFSFSEEEGPSLEIPEAPSSSAVDIQVPEAVESAPPEEPSEQAEAESAAPSEEVLEEPPPAEEALAETDDSAEEALETDESSEEALAETGGSSEEALETDEPSEEQAQTLPPDEDSDLKLKIKSYIPEYKYTVEDKKDPFSKPGALKDVTTLPEDRLHPVEQESIDNIQLKAILWGKDGVVPRALVETKNKTYTLTENDRIGQEGALIARIEMNRIWAMKPVTDPSTGLLSFEPYEKTLSAKSNKQEAELFYER